jgi:cobalt-zinc-cadmium efflux system outer membrane protein
MAAQGNPELLAATWRPEAVRGDLRTARTFPFNPDASFESRSPGEGISGRFEAEIGLELELGGQRGLRGQAGEASLSAAQRRLDDEGRRMLTEVSIAYQGLVAAEQRVALVDEINALNSQLHAAVRTQLAEGEVSVLEANLASIEAARAEARSMAATSARGAAGRELGRLLGSDPSVTIRTTGPSEMLAARTESRVSLQEHIELALSARPDLRALGYDVERARQQEKLSRREAFPNLRISGLATRDDPLGDPELGVAFGLSLPLFNRNQGQADRRRAEISEAEQLRRAAELRIQVDVENALRLFESAERETALLEAELLGPIRENQGLLDTAYREGKIDLANLLLLRNQLLDAELSYWDAWERRERARTGLESATGTIIEGITFTNGSDR